MCVGHEFHDVLPDQAFSMIRLYTDVVDLAQHREYCRLDALPTLLACLLVVVDIGLQPLCIVLGFLEAYGYVILLLLEGFDYSFTISDCALDVGNCGANGTSRSCP